MHLGRMADVDEDVEGVGGRVKLSSLHPDTHIPTPFKKIKDIAV